MIMIDRENSTFDSLYYHHFGQRISVSEYWKYFCRHNCTSPPPPKKKKFAAIFFYFTILFYFNDSSTLMISSSSPFSHFSLLVVADMCLCTVAKMRGCARERLHLRLLRHSRILSIAWYEMLKCFCFTIFWYLCDLIEVCHLRVRFISLICKAATTITAAEAAATQIEWVCE